MICNKGILLKSTGKRVPCGQCMSCRINKGRKWTARILMELCTHDPRYPPAFLTLTYREDTVPLTPDHDTTLEKKAITQWLNNQQKKHGAFRYYLVGEYGDITKRPHYHLALFPTSHEQVLRLCQDWQKKSGFTSSTPLNAERAGYLANYCAKKLTKPDDDRLLPNQEPEFRTSSRQPPLGNDFAESIVKYYRSGKAAQILKQRGDVERTVRFYGRLYPLGDWILKKIRTELGIPLTHTERNDGHDNYWNFHAQQEAQWDPETENNLEASINAKKIQKLYRQTTQKL